MANILKQKQVTEKTTLSGVTIWRLERSGKFPNRVKLAQGRVGWVEAEVDAWLEEQISQGRTPKASRGGA